MWQVLIEEVSPASILRYRLLLNDSAVSYADVIRAWCDDAAFRTFFTDTLAAAPFQAFFWESRPATAANLQQRFEFVLADSPALARAQPDCRPFERKLRDSGSSVAVFPNLGGDALLIVPRATTACEHYPHLAAVVRGAPEDQLQSLWREVGQTVAGCVGDAPLWLSTSGLGVPWAHIRLDLEPKYYTFSAYRELLSNYDA